MEGFTGNGFIRSGLQTVRDMWRDSLVTDSSGQVYRQSDSEGYVDGFTGNGFIRSGLQTVRDFVEGFTGNRFIRSGLQTVRDMWRDSLAMDSSGQVYRQ